MPPATGSCWLVKSEPDCFSIQDLAKAPRQTTHWSGVRNYQARNFMRDQMRLGDRVLFYHSSADPPAVVGTATVVREAYADDTALDPDDDHYDAKQTAENPIWQMVDIRLERIFDRPLPIERLRSCAALRQMVLLQRGSRLSVQPVTRDEFAAVLALADAVESNSTSSGASAAGKSARPVRKSARTSSVRSASTGASQKSAAAGKPRQRPARK